MENEKPMQNDEKVMVLSFLGAATDDMSFTQYRQLKGNQESSSCTQEQTTFEKRKMIMKLNRS